MSPAGPGVSITIDAQNRAQAAFRSFQQDLQGAHNAVGLLNRSNAALGVSSLEAQRQTDQFRRSIGVTGAELRNATLASERLSESQRRFERQVVRGNRSLDDLHDNMRGGRRTMGDYARGIGNIHVQFIALGIANRGLQSILNATAIAQGRAAIQLERLQVGLRAISTDTQAATEQYGRLIEVAKLPGINLENALRSSLQLQAIGQDGARAAEVIGEFGNALALSGQSSNELRRVVEGLRQISGEGKILQEDIAIITARVAALVPGLREAFGGTRAEDIRRTYDALGVAPSDQGARFIEDVLKILRELPRAGNTAANSIENLFDTMERAQAAIGRSFLPLIRESTSTLESFFQQIERDPQLASQIAQFEAFAGTLGTVALGIASVGAISSIVGPGIVAAFTHPVGIAALAIGGLAATLITLKVAAEDTVGPNDRLRGIINDYNVTLSQHAERQRAAAASQTDLTAAITAQTQAREAQAAAQRAVIDAERELAETTGDATEASRRLAEARANLENANTDLENSEKEVESATKETAEAQRQAALTGTEQFNALKEALEADRQAVIDLREELKALDEELLTLIGREDIASLQRVGEIRARRREIVGTPESQTRGLLGQLQDFGTFLSGLNVNNLFADQEQTEEQTVRGERTVGGLLPEAQTRVSIGEVEVDNIERRLGAAGDAAEETGQKVAKTLEDYVTGVADVAANGTQAVAVALQELDNFTIGGGGRGPDPAAEEARRVRDIALDLGDELIRIDEATSLSQINASAQRVAALARDNSLIVEGEASLQALIAATTQQIEEQRAEINRRDFRDARAEEAFEARLAEYEEFERVNERFGELQRAGARAVTAEQKQQLREQLQAFVTTYQHAGGAIQDMVDRASQSIGTLTDQIEDIRFEQLELAVQVNAEEAFDEADIRNAAQTLEDELNESFRNATGFFTQLFSQSATEVAREMERLEERFPDARTIGQFQTIDETNLQNIASVTERIANLDARIAELGQQEAEALGLIALREELDGVLERAIRLNQQLRGVGFRDFALAAEAATETVRVYRDEFGKLRDAFTGRGVSAASLVVGQFEEVDQSTAEALQRLGDIRQDFDRLQTRFGSAVRVRQFESVDRQAQRLRESLRQLLVGLGENGEAVARLDGELSELVESLGQFGYQAEQTLDQARIDERIEDIRDGIVDVVDDLANITISHLFDSLTSETDTAVEAARRRLAEFNEDRAIGLARQDEDQDRRLRRLELARRRILSRRPTGDQRAFERFQDRLAESSQRIAQAREDAALRRSRFEEDTARRRQRLEEAVGRAEGQEGLGGKITTALEQATINALSSAIATGLSSLLKGPLDSIASFLGGGLASLFGDLFGKLFGGGDGDGDGDGDTQDSPMPEGDADVTGTLSEVKTDENTTLPDITGLAGTLSEVKVSTAAPATTLPSITGLSGVLGEVTTSDATTLPSIKNLKGGLKDIVLQSNADRPIVPGLKGGITNIVLQNNASLPSVDGLNAVVDSVVFTDDADFPSLPLYEATISSIAFGEDVEPPELSTFDGVISSLALGTGVTLPDIDDFKSVIESISFAEGVDLPNLPSYQLLIAGITFAEGVDVPDLPSYEALINSIGFAEGVDFPDIPGYAGIINSIAFAEGIDFPDIPAYEAVINSIGFAEGVDFPDIPSYEAVINSIAFAEGIDFPDIPAYEAVINGIGFAEGVDFPDIPGYAGIINSIDFAAAIDFPDLPAYKAVINSIDFAQGVDFPDIPGYAGIINNIGFTDGVDFPSLPSYDATINSIAFAEGIDFPNLPQFEGIVGSLALAQGLSLSAVNLEGRVNIIGTQGGGGGEDGLATTDEDPENPQLDDEEISGLINDLSIDPAAIAAIEPVILKGVIRPTLDLSGIPDPIVLRGRIDATVNVQQGGTATPRTPARDDGEDRQTPRAEDVENYSTVPELTQSVNDLNTTIKDATVSGNLNPALGPTPRIDIPDILDRLNEQTDFTRGAPINAGQQGFGETLRSVNQFQREGGAGGGGTQGSALRVTFPPELFQQLAQETTLQTGFLFANQYLEAVSTEQKNVTVQLEILNSFLSNGMFPAIDTRLANAAQESTLASIHTTLDYIRRATERTADAPLVEELRRIGVSFPNDPTDPTNAALTASPIVDILGRGGLNLFANFDLLAQRFADLLPDETANQDTDATTPEPPDESDTVVPNAMEATAGLATEATLASIGSKLNGIHLSIDALAVPPDMTDTPSVVPTNVADMEGPSVGLDTNPDMQPVTPEFAEQLLARLQDGIKAQIMNDKLPVEIVGSVPLDVSGSSVETTPAPGSVQEVAINQVLQAIVQGGQISVDNTLAVQVLNRVAVSLGAGDISALSDRLFSDNVERQNNNRNSLLDAG